MILHIVRIKDVKSRDEDGPSARIRHRAVKDGVVKVLGRMTTGAAKGGILISADPA